MKKTASKMLSVSLALLLGAFCAGCADKTDDTPGAAVDKNYQWLNTEKYKDTSDLTSWEDLGQTKKLNLTLWNTALDMATGETSESDVVNPEIARVTGVSVGQTLDNKGKKADARIADLYMSNKLPDIAYGGWVDKEYCYNLYDYIDYLPTLKARLPKEAWSNVNITLGEKNALYALPGGMGSTSLASFDSKADPKKTILFSYSTDNYPFVYVREDILKDAYPNAKTQAEIDATYNEKGYFTENDLFDVEITSASQFRNEFLKKIYDTIHSAKDSKGEYKYKASATEWVAPMTASAGTDKGYNDGWDFGGQLLPRLLGGMTINNDMFTYWDKVDKEIKLLYEQDFYNAELKEWSTLLREGKYVNEEGWNNDRSTIVGRYNTGMYAIGYGASSYPQSLTCAARSVSDEVNGTNVKYRKVYMKIPVGEHFEPITTGGASGVGICLLKDKVREEDIPQILRWYDYQFSELNDKLISWGPRSAGLFTEDENGVRQFKDEELANQMVYSTSSVGALVKKYNLYNGMLLPPNPVFTCMYMGANRHHPKCVYDISSIPGISSAAFSSGAVCTNIKLTTVAKDARLRFWTNVELGTSDDFKFFARRDMFTEKFNQLIRSGGGSAFDAKLAEVKAVSDTCGWTDELLQNATYKFKELNEAYKDVLGY